MVETHTAKLPYNCLTAFGNVLFAARSGRIHSFNTDSGSHVSSWSHADVTKPRPRINIELEIKAQLASNGANEENGSSVERPAKKQKLSDDETAAGPEGASSPNDAEPAEPAQGQKSKGKKKKWKSRDVWTKVPDRAMVSLMALTADGRHLVAMSAHDKAITVLAHDGIGQLDELSKRIMPKRPCALAISPDGSTIFCGDKFGDVYALPLLATEQPVVSTPSVPSAPSTPSTPVSQVSGKPFRPQADASTVHTGRNLLSLQMQQKQAEKRSAPEKQEAPTFERTLLLGHVSMLTALVLAQSGSRSYIITADRDEHIRVSRSIPNAHIIENFCFGHTEFVSALTIPPSRPELLISGGGDGELFIWDWVSGEVVSRADVLSHAQLVTEGITKISVSRLYSGKVAKHGHGEHGVACVLALCEDIPAVFYFEITEQNEAVHSQTVVLPGNPLSLAMLTTEDGSIDKLIAAIDPAETEGSPPANHLLALDWDNHVLVVQPVFSFLDSQIEYDELDVLRETVRDLLYNTGTLRKQAIPEGSDGEQEVGDAEE